MGRSANTQRIRSVLAWQPTRRRCLIALTLVSLGVLGILGKAFTSDDVFAFRDAAHFYYPLFEWTTAQWKLGHVPLWNPLEGLGAPVIAESTSSVFYPGKLLLLLPGPFGLWFKTYIVGHVFLCGATAFRLARHWQFRHSAATLTALSYALSGNVLFQYCNVVYLVGAAWLPLAIRYGDGLLANGRLTNGRFRNGILLACCLAMMVLGGDAQMAYHTGMLLIGLAWLQRRPRKSTESNVPRNLAVQTARLALAAIVAIGLAAVQSLPSANWIGSSTRASFDAPRNLYEFGFSQLTNDGRTGFGSTLLGQTQPGHHSTVYDFSVGPWRFIEFLWPNIGGKMFPQNQRWMNAIPAEGRVWTPTLYMGLLPVLLASLSFRLRGGTVKRRFLSWSLLLSAMAGLGGYGLGWLVAEIQHDLGGQGELPIGRPFGGLYWLFTVVLPGYVYFRYPAKLWIITTLAISQLAGLSFDRALAKGGLAQIRLKRRLWFIAIVSVIVARFIHIDWPAWLANAPDSPPFGPLDVFAVQPAFVSSMVHTVVLAFSSLAVVWILSAKKLLSSLAWILVLLTAIELVIAHQWFVPLAPASALTKTLAGIGVPMSSPLNLSSQPAVPIRFHREPNTWYPYWMDTSSAHRFEEVLAFNNMTLFPKHHLSQGVGAVPSRSSVSSAYEGALISAIMDATHPLGTMRVRFFEDLGISYQIKRNWTDDTPWLPSTSIHTRPNQSDAVISPLARNSPRRVWIVREIEWAPSVDPCDVSALANYCRHIVRGDPKTGLRDFGVSAVVEIPVTGLPTLPDDALLSDSPLSDAPVSPTPDGVEIVYYSETQVRLLAELSKPGLLVLNDTYTDDWKAYVTTPQSPIAKPVPIYRTNAIMRGVHLPAGKFEIEMRYEPRDFYVGATLSGITWCGCILYLVIHFGFQFVRRVRAYA